jgi:hypothetical protein
MGKSTNPEHCIIISKTTRDNSRYMGTLFDLMDGTRTHNYKSMVMKKYQNKTINKPQAQAQSVY